MISENYLMGVRIGKAIVGYEILERVMRMRLKEEYKIYKYRLRRLSDIEVNKLMMELIVATDINIIKKYI